MGSQEQGNEHSCIKVFPTVEDCKIKNMIRCTEKGCSSVFTSESNFLMHVTKTHKRINLTLTSLKQYYCPELGCVYNVNRYFKNMKHLRQHYLKIHAERNFFCDKCQGKFPSKALLKCHSNYCGIKFICCDCKESYVSYETLRTHGRRKKHKILNKIEYKTKVPCSNVSQADNFKQILPKSIKIILLPVPRSKNTRDQGSQTDDDRSYVKIKMTQAKATEMCQISQQTQTGNRNDQFSVETQTIGDFINRKNMDLLLDSLTQTDSVESKTISCNTLFNLNDLELSDVETNSSSTQTVYSASARSCDSIHTDTSDLLVANSLSCPINNFEFDNCHMETQTDFLLEDEMFNCDYYSNMYTQTCDDILNQFGFNDIQTQTVYDDMLHSVESQTMMSHIMKGNSCKDTSHMETQTDADFRQMLEVINF